MPFRDFDAGQKARQPLQFQFKGKPHVLPASPAATKVIAFMNYDQQTGTPDQARLLLEDLFEGKIAEFQAAGMDWATLNELEMWALGHWGLGPGTEKPLMERIDAMQAEMLAIVDQGEKEGVLSAPIVTMMRKLHQSLSKISAANQPADEAEQVDAGPKSASTRSSGGGRS